MNNWRLDPVTKAQKRAIHNMSKRWKIETSGANNKGEACDEIGRLTQVIASIKLKAKQSRGYGFGINPAITDNYQIHYDLGLCGQ